MANLWNANDRLARARERFESREPLKVAVRSEILHSWERCQALGLRPDRFEPPYDENLDLESRLVRAAAPVLAALESAVANERVSVVLTDAQGRVLRRRSGDRAFDALLDAVQLAPGFRFSERIAGTCGVGTALAERKVQHVQGAEHFTECLQRFSCFTAPMHDPLSGRIEGAVNLTCLAPEADTAMENMVREAGEAIARRMLDMSSQRERALFRAYLEARRARPEVVAESGLVGLGALSTSGLTRHDQEVLREKAAELVSCGIFAAADVPLSGGLAATLVCRPLVTASGVHGAAVEIVLPATPKARIGHERLPGREAGNTRSTHAGTDVRGTGAGGAEEAHARGADPELLLVGEPVVGEIALRARRRLQVLSEAGVRIGTTLDVSRTAAELAEVAVPRLADFVTIDLLHSVVRGEEPLDTGEELHRAAFAGLRPECPFYPVGRRFRFLPSTPQGQCLATGESVLEPDLTVAPGWLAQDPVRGEKLLLGHGIHSLMTVVLRCSGRTLGVACFYRSERPEPFEDDDLALAEEVCAHAAVCIDNARRFTREHAVAVALQRSLLPQELPEHDAVEAAYRYLPAQSGVGGDWFDVIPLSGARVALVVGDVVGHGVHAAATMGRLRTAIHNFAALDVPPDELLAHLDNLVAKLDGAGPTQNPQQITGTSCLYAVYDPTTGRCTMARAGHYLPALVPPEGGATFPDLPSGPPLGLGGLPFETAELVMEPGSQLVFFTDGLLADYRDDIEIGLERLRRTLGSCQDSPPEETCEAVMKALLPRRVGDDVTLLVACTKRLGVENVRSWDLPSDPAAVSSTRAAITRQLEDWGLDELAFTTELMLSELVTNAIRYASGPITLRMLRSSTSLISEVHDGSSTSPHLRYASTTDEGGRGLFLVAQLAECWGTRYTPRGKIIWAEQEISAPGPA